MKVAKENLENQVALIKVVVSEADYSEAVEKQLKAYKKKAQLPGFRPGMVPMGVVNKMYRKGVTAEESYRIASKGVFDYIQENKIEIIGDPIPSEKQEELDFENGTEFEFAFEIGLAPEINIDFSKLTLSKYEIMPDAEVVTNFKDSYLRRYGKLVDKDVVALDEALSVSLDGEDISIEDAYVGLISMNEEDRKPFIGKKVGDKMEVNVKELYKTPSQLASILSVKEEELEGINPMFNLTITRIRKFENPELNEEFFKEAFADGSVTTAEQFDKFVNDKIAENLESESSAKMIIDGKKKIVETAALSLPDSFLKKWLLAINEGKFTMEDIEKEYSSFSEYICWSSICNFYSVKAEYAVTQEEVKSEARLLALMQFSYYGIANPEEQMLDNYINSILQNKEEARRIQETLLAKKTVEYIATQAKVVKEKISYKDFAALAQQL